MNSLALKCLDLTPISESAPSELLPIAVLLPLIGALGVMLCGRWPNVREGVTLLCTGLTFGAVYKLYPIVAAGHRPRFELLELLEGLPLVFELEPLGMLYALVASGLWIPTALYGIGYMRAHEEDNQTRFFACFALAIFAALGIAFSGNLLTLFVFYEVMTLSTYPLVTHYGNDEARRAGRIYLGILFTTSVAFLLLAVLSTWWLTGTLDFRMGGILAGQVDGPLVPVLLGLFAFGTGKAALMPFHHWLPNAMVAPTPVSALLHAVAIVKAGVFTILKVIVYIFGIEFLSDQNASVWLMYAAAFTILSASIIALKKDNLKARLAYSTISQLAYIVLGGALATSAGVLGAGLHIAMHAVGKITLFFCAGAIYVATHKKKISQMDGLGKRMPFTYAAFFLASLSIIGLPPMGGSWSKWFLALGAVHADQWIFVAVLMLSSLLSIGYLMPIIARGFFRPGPDEVASEGESAPVEDSETTSFWAGIQEAPLLCVLPLSLTALGCLALFALAPDIYDFLAPITAP